MQRSASAQEGSQKALERQIEQSTLSIQMDAWHRAQDVWTEKVFTDGRGQMFARLRAKTKVWTAQEKENAKEVCRRMDKFAALVPFLGGSNRVLAIWDDPLGKCWLVLEEIVKDERETTEWQTKWHSFEELGLAALDKLRREGRDPRADLQNG